jgi:cytoskeletal protein CcmA (bactofilin family)
MAIPPMYDCSLIAVPQREDEVADYDWENFPPSRHCGGKTSFCIVDACTGIEGKLITRTAFVHGRVQGLVFAEHVTVEPTGRVNGVIFCRTLAVLGAIHADVICDNVRVRSGGWLSGTLKYRTIRIEAGGLVGGRFERRAVTDGRAGRAMTSAMSSAGRG